VTNPLHFERGQEGVGEPTVHGASNGATICAVRTNMSDDRTLRAVVFDVGGVLLDWDPRHLYRKLIPDPFEMEWFLANVCTPQWHDPHDRGAGTAHSCAVLARRWPAYAELIWAWWERGEEMVAGPLGDGVALLRQVVDSGLACYALTNMEAETYPRRRRRYEFLSWFSGTLVSGFEGVAKPDPQIYEVLIGRFGLDPETTLFIDDQEVNVAAAAQVGMEAHLYTGPEPVLARLGLVRG
jgi:2-haloacid dehalogenase